MPHNITVKQVITRLHSYQFPFCFFAFRFCIMLFVLDNYDSFTYNLVQRFGEIDSSIEMHVARNDQTTLDEIAEINPTKIVISPGPGTPNDAGLSKQIVERFGKTTPLLGVCLGHQCIAEVFGAKVIRANRLMHGKVSEIQHTGTGLFASLDNPMTATRYHSLIVPRASIPEELELTAWVEEEGHDFEVMGLKHRDYPIHAVQFHPESFLTTAGTTLLENFLKM